MAGQIWEVVGGADADGVIVRIARQRTSPQFPERLSNGCLVMGRERAGDRLLYDRIAGTGYGPNSGWVTIKQDDYSDLLIPVDVKPPKAGWKILTAPLPVYTPPPVTVPEVKRPVPQEPGPYGELTYGKKLDDLVDYGPERAVGPQTQQTPNEPFSFYHHIHFHDTKASGYRMSACLVAMDECRTDVLSMCDQTVESFRKVNDPIVQLSIELRPEIMLTFKAKDGLLYTHPRSTGPILSWVKVEAQFGWPMFPLRNEVQHIYHIGKDKTRSKAACLADGKFQVAFTDESGEEAVALSGEEWETQFEKFFKDVKSNHSAKKMDERQLHKSFYASGQPFLPTLFKKVTWRMSFLYGDFWKVLYHAKVPELLWELNMALGGPFAELVEDEGDPQAMTVTLPRPMKVGMVYDAYCFMEEAKKKAVYLLVPEGKPASDCVLAVCALYSWDVPMDGKTLRSEDLEVVGAAGRNHLIGFAAGGEAKVTKFLDLESLGRP